MASYTLNLDSASDGLTTSLIAAVQAAYDAGPGYPTFTVTQGYVASGAVHVGLQFWLAPRFAQPSYPKGAPANLPTAAKLTPTVAGASTLAVTVAAEDVTYATAIAAAVGGGVQVGDVLGCALCTGLSALSGVPVQVGPWL